MKSRIMRNRRREGGAALAEYGLLVAGIVLVSLVAVSVLGGKVGGLIGTVATLLPGAYTDQNAPVHVGDEGGALVGGEPAVPRLGQALGTDGHGASHLYQHGSKSNPYH